MRLKTYGFVLTAIIGLGLATPQNVATEYGRIDGAYDDYTRKPTRQLTLTGRVQGASYLRLRDNRSSLAQLLDRDLIAQDQRLVLLHHLEDARGQVSSDTSRIVAKYQGGFGGNTDNHYAESVPITFTHYLPAILADKEEGAALTVQQSVADANGILQRSPTGVWSAMSTGVSGGAGDKIMAIVRASDGTVYAGGDFTDAGGSGADYIAKWNGSAWSALGSVTALNAEVVALALGPDGSVYVGGLFGNAGGDANADSIAKWNGSAWSALGTGTNGIVLCIAVAPNGDVYIGGTFTLAGGVANTVRIAKWNGSAWSALGTGANGSVTNLAFAPDGTLYAVGDFTTIGGVTVNGIAKWNGSAWSAMAGGAGTVNMDGLAIAKNGLIYAGGSTTTIGGVTVNNIGAWNGSAWAPLGSGVNAQAYRIVVAPDGTIYVGGPISAAGGITVPDGLVRWNGAAWIYADVDLPSAPTVQAIAFAPDGTLYVGFNTAGTATTAANTTVTNGGTAYAYPTFVIKGPSSGTSRIYQITNYTTGRSIYLNLTLNAGETAILRFTPDNLSFVSDFQGDLAGKILPGSNEADFFLQPGANVISFFAAGSTVTATIAWRPSFVSLDDTP